MIINYLSDLLVRDVGAARGARDALGLLEGVLQPLVVPGAGEAVLLGFGLVHAPLGQPFAALVDGALDRLAHAVLRLQRRLERANDALGKRGGRLAVRLALGLHLRGGVLPRHADAAHRVLGVARQLCAQLVQALGVLRLSV